MTVPLGICEGRVPRDFPSGVTVPLGICQGRVPRDFSEWG